MIIETNQKGALFMNAVIYACYSSGSQREETIEAQAETWACSNLPTRYDSSIVAAQYL
jgi:hypothetical protein